MKINLNKILIAFILIVSFGFTVLNADNDQAASESAEKDNVKTEQNVSLDSLKAITAEPKNPLTEAMSNGLPTVLDLGAGYCIPCKMMKPIFAELEVELKGKANVLLLEISEYKDIANEYKVRVIPTQIFFDQNGNQYWRHEGFLSKEDILAKLQETGAEL